VKPLDNGRKFFKNIIYLILGVIPVEGETDGAVDRAVCGTPITLRT
jgi:hypothetical protein